MTDSNNIGVLQNNFSVPLQSTPPTFNFNQALDIDYLNEYYQGNLSDAAFMYDVFLSCTVQKFYEFIESVNSDNIAEARRLAHQMTPTFMLVGLTNIARQLSEVANREKESHSLRPLFESIISNFNKKFPFILHQKIEIDTFLSQ